MSDKVGNGYLNDGYNEPLICEKCEKALNNNSKKDVCISCNKDFSTNILFYTVLVADTLAFIFFSIMYFLK